MSIQDRIIELRQARGLSREEIAEAVGVHLNAIGRYERGEAKPSFDILLNLSTLFNVSIDYLAGAVDEQIERELLQIIVQIQELPEEEKERIIFTIKALLRDARARQNYSE